MFRQAGFVPSVADELSHKQSDQFAYAREMIVIMLGLKVQHVY
jgi:hypothetical protein